MHKQSPAQRTILPPLLFRTMHVTKQKNKSGKRAGSRERKGLLLLLWSISVCRKASLYIGRDMCIRDKCEREGRCE